MNEQMNFFTRNFSHKPFILWKSYLHRVSNTHTATLLILRQEIDRSIDKMMTSLFMETCFNYTSQCGLEFPMFPLPLSLSLSLALPLLLPLPLPLSLPLHVTLALSLTCTLTLSLSLTLSLCLWVWPWYSLWLSSSLWHLLFFCISAEVTWTLVQFSNWPTLLFYFDTTCYPSRLYLNQLI